MDSSFSNIQSILKEKCVSNLTKNQTPFILKDGVSILKKQIPEYGYDYESNAKEIISSALKFINEKGFNKVFDENDLNQEDIKLLIGVI